MRLNCTSVMWYYNGFMELGQSDPNHTISILTDVLVNIATVL